MQSPWKVNKIWYTTVYQKLSLETHKSFLMVFKEIVVIEVDVSYNITQHQYLLDYDFDRN